MKALDQITPIEEVIPETIITEVEKPHIVNFDAKITSKHPKATWDIGNPPYWSHERSEQRAQRRQERIRRPFRARQQDKGAGTRHHRHCGLSFVMGEW